ncbi:unnamed protein product [Tilletia laevis]|uniref:Uncharacterized protein n=2 Tax=Tilletia TaxID=13289 RepID=A0A177VIH5_9BASI|nr:hypothetical protein CF336_g591 [Tilletia laevis]KAE8265827.1 hypothetical protein A4X03_0g17 [Tilletia caries]KAE8208608.1 hypothetical protein CF335_g287 [Tilletia laevis]CAD6891266.1 unnamed protein product [Tilletia caries]CAD6926193.1 unnamed protein product [Tilletia caries]
MPPTTRRMMLRTPRSSLGDATADSPSASAAAPDGDGDGGGGGEGEWEVSDSSTSALPSTSATTATSGTSSTATTVQERTANAGSASHADRPSSSSSLRTPHIYSLRMPVRTGADPPPESSSSASAASTSRRRPPSDDPSRSAPVPTGLFWSFDGPPGSASASVAASTGLRPPPGDVPQWRPAYVQPADLGRRSRNSGNNRVRFAPDSPSSLSSLSSPSAAENPANDEPRASGSTTTAAAAAAAGPAASTSTAAARRRALRIPSRLREGGEAPHQAIVIDDLLHSSDEDDDDFTVLSSHTNPATLDRLTDERLLRQAALGWPDHDLGRAPTPIRRPGDAVRSHTGVSRPSVVVPRMSDQDRSNYRFIDGIPAGPHRYRHRERAVHFASGGAATGSGGPAASASATATATGGGGVAGLPPVGHPLHPDSLAGEEGIMRHIGIYPPMRFRPEHRKVPDRFETRWTHPEAVQEGFSHSIVEPPIEVDMEPGALPTGPLPETTPICARCRYALQMGGAGDKKIWVLPCGHVIDGKCVRELSEPAWKEPVVEPGPEAKSAAVVVVIDGEEEKEEPSKALQNGEAKANGKARAVSVGPSEGTPQKRTASMRDDEEKAEDEEKGDRVEDKDGSTAGSESGTPRSKRRHLDVPGSTTASGETMGATRRGTSPDPIDAGSQSFEILYSTTSSTTTATNGSSSSASRREKGKGSKRLIDDEDEAVIVSGVKLQPVPFTCPVVDCGQLCFPKGDHDLSVIEMFI